MVNTHSYPTAQDKEDIWQKAYAKRRQWTRTDTERWLEERNDALGQLLLKSRSCNIITPRTRKFAYALRINASPIFDRAHTRLARLSTDKREAYPLEKIIR